MSGSVIERVEISAPAWLRANDSFAVTRIAPATSREFIIAPFGQKRSEENLYPVIRKLSLLDDSVLSLKFTVPRLVQFKT
jgi:hypothetical protein